MKGKLGFLLLACASLPALEAQNYSGAVNSASCDAVTGWAWDGTQPNTPINVDLYDSTIPIATVTANIYRADLYSQGIGNGYHGFSFTVTPTLMDGQTHHIYAYISGTQIALQNNGSYAFSCPANSTGYKPYYTDTLTSTSSNWTQSGSVSLGASGLTATSSSGGALISTVAVPDGTSDYEVRTTLTLAASGGTYVNYVRATTGAMTGPSAMGTFYSLEVTPTFNGSACSADVRFNKSISGTITTLMDSQLTCHSGMVVRLAAIGSTFRFVTDNQLWQTISDSSITTGKPGVGGLNMPAGNSIASVSLGPADRTAPTMPSAQLISSSLLPTKAYFRLPGAADNANGTGVIEYWMYRDGAWLATSAEPEFRDKTIAASSTHTYTFYALDYHANVSSGISVTVTSPPAGSIDARRVGTQPTGAYWGAAPEQIDVRSGNLNFTLPLLKARARGGWSVPFNLTYNSQNWRKDSGGAWDLGADVGYGYGWKLMAGSLTPFYSGAWTLDHYLFVDSTGAEYLLSTNTNGVWSSQGSIFVWHDSNANILHFRDGSFWVMGCVSGGTEADAGTMYPSIIEDTNGNQILVRYYAGSMLAFTNSSSRIQEIEDVRAVAGVNDRRTYTFLFSAGTPHLTNIQNWIGTGEGYSFNFATQTDPFAGGSFPGGMTGLSSITISNVNLQYAFSYNNSGEMLQATLPYKGYLKWSYGAASYSSGFTQREVQSRTLSKDGTAGSEKVYSFSHESNTNANPVHSYTILDDPGGVGEKYWAFNVSGSYIGLLSQYQGRDRSYTPTRTLTQNDITWAGSENPYLSSNLTTADPGQSYSVQSKTTQTLDSYGNVTQVAKYNFGNLSTAYRTYNYTYLNSSAYTSRYIYNRLTSATVTDGTNTSTLQSIIYDGGSLAAASGEHEWDTNYGSVTARGNPTSITDTSGTRTMSYNELGNAVSVTPNGVTRSISTSTTTNFAATEQLTVGSLTTTNTYSSFLGLTNETGPNSASISMGYDLIARPNSVTGVFGTATTNTYNDTASPPTFVSTINGRWTRQTLDGFGRTILTETGDANGTKSQAETVFDSCGCSPFGKMTKQAFAHAPNTSPAYTTYAYDGIGRTLTVAAGGSDTTGTTTYLYQGNTIKLTDAAGKWKKFTMDALGNLLQVKPWLQFGLLVALATAARAPAPRPSLKCTATTPAARRPASVSASRAPGFRTST